MAKPMERELRSKIINTSIIGRAVKEREGYLGGRFEFRLAVGTDQP
jgi:hypothetical protein